MSSPRRVIISLLGALGLVFFPACLPVPQPPGDEQPGSDITATVEVEPNNSMTAAAVVTLDAQGRARLQGTILGLELGVDSDYFDLGPMSAGDQIQAYLNTSGSDLQGMLGVFDADSKLFVLSQEEIPRGATAPRSPDIEWGRPLSIDEIVRHESSNYYLVVSRKPGVGNVKGPYEVLVRVRRGLSVPAPRSQIVLLDYRPATVTVPGQGVLVFDAFDPGAINSRYAGQADTVKRQITRTVRQNYARYAVQVYDSDEDITELAAPYSTVYFGGACSAALGMELGETDFYNHDADDSAIVFTDSFTLDLFTSPPHATGLGSAMGNVASHEIAHLLGLSHVVDSGGTDLMSALEIPDRFLTDLRFRDNASLAWTLFPVPNIWLSQDAGVMLTETVGRAASAVASDITVGTGPMSVTASDYDADGDLDLTIGCPLASELWLVKNENGAFPNPFSFRLAPTGVVAADFNGDGAADLAATDRNSGDAGVYVFLTGDDGVLTDPAVYALQDGPWAMAAADLNGDGRPDLVVSHFPSETVSALLNLGDGGFGVDAGAVPVPFANALAGGDLDGDGREDVAVASLGSSTSAAGVYILPSNGDGSFGEARHLLGDALTTSVAVADLNGDQRPDIVVTDSYANLIYVVLNDGLGRFEDAQAVGYPVGGAPVAIAAGDLDGDTYVDLAVANSSTNDVSVLLGRGDGTFESEWPFSVGAEPSAVTIVDLNSDGHPDLAVANLGGDTVSLLLGRGDGTFGAL
ncbi:MAG TPA: VCBS repeat-containing protein [Phycisphaerae bacterium]|nr:VCBS repeat-containing protein [Phycisphaerae bacterium]HRY71126.1 VCBS repeat-containing protein [Phycisphaerae bacterium]HSA29464.1 VCBS repeat-containing protein [Phycisphaerae bacterium]